MRRHALKGVIRVLSLFAIAIPSGCARDLRYLWFTFGSGDTESFDRYERGVRHLANAEPSTETENTWNITFWDSSFDPSAARVGSYNILAAPLNQSAGQRVSKSAGQVLFSGVDAGWRVVTSPRTVGLKGAFGYQLSLVDWPLPKSHEADVAWSYGNLPVDASAEEFDSFVPAAVPALNSAAQPDFSAAFLKNGCYGCDTAQWSLVKLDSGERPFGYEMAEQKQSSLPDPLLAAACFGMGLLMRRVGRRKPDPVNCPDPPKPAGYNEGSHEPRRTRVRRYRIRRVSTLYYLP